MNLNSSNRLKSSICPFCLYGCELAFTYDENYLVFNVEYAGQGEVNQGRLCPRGNAVGIVLNHKRRLAYPLYNNKEVDWDKALSEIAARPLRQNSEAIAITFDRNLTEEETGLIYDFAERLGVENLACSYLEPESYFVYSVEDCLDAELADIENAKAFVLIGDVFGQTPVIAKPILNARYAHRDHRIFVIDSILTRTAGFADRFLHCQPGSEPLVVLALKSLLTREIKGLAPEQIAEVSGIKLTLLEEVANSLTKLKPIVVVCTMSFGRNDNPYLLSLASKSLVAKSDGMKFLGLGEARSGLGKVGFGQILSAIREGKIKVLLNFGTDFPFLYPQLRDLAELETMIATAVFRPNQLAPYFILPTALNLEKNGTINTLWGKVKINKILEPISGSKTISEIITLLNQKLNFTAKIGTKTKNHEVIIPLKQVYELAREFLNTKSQTESSETDSLLLVGEKPAIGFWNIFDKEDVIKINLQDLQRFNLKQNEPAKVIGPAVELELLVKTTNQVPPGIALVGVNRIENRQLFTTAIDKATNNVIFPPTRVRLWQKG
ncbi:MAG: molybdopterin-dependent oxidoreductase [candidate division WOR-3 bacterium]